jgi:hypothetical protein
MQVFLQLQVETMELPRAPQTHMDDAAQQSSVTLALVLREFHHPS